MTTKWNALDQGADDTIVAAIASLHKAGETLQTRIQQVLCAIGVRWAATGDSRPAVLHINMLLTKDKLKGVRKNAIMAWVELHLGMTVVEEGENKGQFFVHASKNDGKHLNVKAMHSERWWEMTQEPEYKPLVDPMQLIKGLCAKFEKDRAKLGEESAVSPELIAELRSIGVPEVLQ